MNIWQNSKGVSGSCPNASKLYNIGVDAVDIMDQKTAAYILDRKRKYHFYLSMFFDLMDLKHVN